MSRTFDITWRVTVDDPDESADGWRPDQPADARPGFARDAEDAVAVYAAINDARIAADRGDRPEVREVFG